jgi:hypothetical protein
MNPDGLYVHFSCACLQVVEYRGEQIGGLEDLREPYMLFSSFIDKFLLSFYYMVCV